MSFPARKRFLFISALLLILFSGFGPEFNNDQTDPAIQEKIRRIETSLYPIYNLKGHEQSKTINQMMLENKIVGLSMAFVDNGKIAWTRSYGYANLADSIRITPNTLFRAASLSKTLTAMAALHCVEQGLLSLDQDINQQLKGWKLPENDFTKTQKVTVAELIGHTSGIKNNIHDAAAPDIQLPDLEDILSGKTKYPAAEVISIPGEKRKYSNMGYMVLSELLQDVTSTEFSKLMQQILLKPCKMNNSTFSQELSKAFKNNIATAYDENRQMIPFYKHASYGAGALWSTPTDLCKFLAEIMDAYHDPKAKGKIISHAMAQKVFEKKNKKLGFNKYYEDDHFVFRNDGSIPGYNCILMGSLHQKQAVVIMLNTGSDQAYDFLNYLWRSVSMTYHWGLFEPEFYNAVSSPETELTKFAGHFTNRHDSFSIDIQDQHLEIRLSETVRKQLIAIGKTSFLIPEKPMKFDFELDSSGAVLNLFVRDAGGNGRDTYFRIP